MPSKLALFSPSALVRRAAITCMLFQLLNSYLSHSNGPAYNDMLGMLIYDTAGDDAGYAACFRECSRLVRVLGFIVARNDYG